MHPRPRGGGGLHAGPLISELSVRISTGHVQGKSCPFSQTIFVPASTPQIPRRYAAFRESQSAPFLITPVYCNTDDTLSGKFLMRLTLMDISTSDVLPPPVGTWSSRSDLEKRGEPSWVILPRAAPSHRPGLRNRSPGDPTAGALSSPRAGLAPRTRQQGDQQGENDRIEGKRDDRVRRGQPPHGPRCHRHV